MCFFPVKKKTVIHLKKTVIFPLFSFFFLWFLFVDFLWITQRSKPDRCMAMRSQSSQGGATDDGGSTTVREA